MLKFISGACAAMMTLTIPFATPATAMPTGAPVFSQQDVVNVQYRDRDRRWDRRGDRRDRGRFERRGNYHYYNGHRGYREARRGYRQHNGYWFPPAAFIAGAIIGGAIANQPPVQYRPRGGGNAHVQWCYDRYRSYDARSNTYQPYNGPRRQCNSPYG